MKSSGYRSIFHIYLIFFLSLFGALTAAVILSFLLFSLQKPDGSLVRSDWPRKFTEQFGGTDCFYRREAAAAPVGNGIIAGGRNRIPDPGCFGP